MICYLCGGQVTWRGPITNLTHTECAGCGRRNCQQVIDEVCRTCGGSGAVHPDWGDYPRPSRAELGEEPLVECPDCYGRGAVSP
jgi:RecJ-like exonuclease